MSIGIRRRLAQITFKRPGMVMTGVEALLTSAVDLIVHCDENRILGFGEMQHWGRQLAVRALGKWQNEERSKGSMELGDPNAAAVGPLDDQADQSYVQTKALHSDVVMPEEESAFEEPTPVLVLDEALAADAVPQSEATMIINHADVDAQGFPFFR